jgi:Ca2+-binding RTX toxin-like protein
MGGVRLLPGIALVVAVLGFAPQASAESGFFSPTGLTSVRRVAAAAAPLPDGRVLIAGGDDYGLSLSSAEVFDPATNTFSSAGIGSMTGPRRGAVAAPLPDGRVLIAGGNYGIGGGPLSSAEIFDPATNNFSSAGIGSMSVPRDAAVAAPLPDGRVLVMGGCCDSGGPYSSAEIFDPATNSFSSTGIGSMTIPREYAAAAPLPDGRVLIAGGSPTGQDLNVTSSAEVFDPATNSFSSTGIGSMTVSRGYVAAAPLPDGRVLLAGGYSAAPTYSSLASAEVFDPATNTFSSAGIGFMTVRRNYAVAAALRDGRVLVAGGYDGDDSRSADVFAPISCEGRQATVLASNRADRTFMGTPGADVIVGLSGNDELSGLAGDDVICGEEGKDTLYGQNGNDMLSGEASNDTLAGGAGNDILKGGPGKDILKGGPGNDILKGSAGKDILRGGPGRDTLKGGPGKDKQVQ